ncbi:alanine--tRNA ligase [Frankia sp. AgB1.9]|uniref:alanine--tRNA ligase n=1 Tax=unclassified Frankia TaxID=2632575 RepID=UPI001933BF18|nr:MULTISPECIES: alanine--tRNA ligase [unclassified Frankia]MBL7493191.1 alanine--tRNA ligase [Frankia sp. AgW1.1]MBL7549071.1 alanine--tRNA ligase [Frankia sp. AgB1.9]MBL7624284.1 alanine--tRNA ligase [Frankia sp. AgB1.8]
METAEIRRRFLNHFEQRGHLVVPSASLIAEDPTLLLVNAGMVPFKPYFLGDLTPPAPRATSVQKCVRTVDIDNVGQTARHASFFQMCGNFSFGDYFKAEVIPWAFELLTEGYGFKPDDLWATVYLDDDEAEEIWKGLLPAERIQRRGKEDNYWSMGVPGPCGPCSEIYFDRGPAYGRDGGPEADENRYLEVWNLVFMQFERGEGAGYEFPILGDLPAKSIDTGMGLERMATLLQGVENLYEIDISRPVLDRAGELTGKSYGAQHGDDVRLRVIADHTRTAAMLIADGVVPSNEGRGYVLRRMLRRAVRNVRLLGGREPVMENLFGVVQSAMGPIYPELVDRAAAITAVAVGEELAFLETLRTGTTIFDVAVGKAKSTGAAQLAGEEAFQLHDTYGFPIDLTLEMAAEQGLTVDEPGFRRLMDRQRELAKADRASRRIGNVDLSVFRPILARSGATSFTGYTELTRTATVVGLVSAATGLGVPAAGEGEDVGVVIDSTPFYAESGGQEADLGRFVFDGGEVEIIDVQKPIPDLVLHRGKVVRGEIRLGTEVEVTVDADRRRAVSRSHTATHLVHTAFRRALGESATQAGSLNSPGRLRFDFHALGSIPAAVLADVEDEVNEVALRDLDVTAFVTSQDEARRIGAMALFGEKYGERVRVVDVGDYSRELCGGTHVARSAQLGAVKLLSESSISAGTRRVEGLVGLDAFRYLAREHLLVSQLSGLLKVRADELPDRVSDIVTRLRDAERELERVRGEAVLAGAAGLANSAVDVGGVALVAAEAPNGTSPDDLRKLVLDVRGRLIDRPAIVAAASAGGERAFLVVATTEGSRGRGLKAGDLVKAASAELGGSGGGKPDVAQGGGTDVSGVGRALAKVRDLVAASTGS